VLAALVPERVLPFASGDSRKRGPGRKNRGGAPKGERAPSLALPRKRGGTREGPAAASGLFPGAAIGNGCAVRRSASLLCEGSFGMAFLRVAWTKLGCKCIARTGVLFPPHRKRVEGQSVTSLFDNVDRSEKPMPRAAAAGPCPCHRRPCHRNVLNCSDSDRATTRCSSWVTT
jgi:hypothetical protein